MNKLKIAILLPVCSRFQTYDIFEETPIKKGFLPHFLESCEKDRYEYKIFVGIDDDDEYYLENMSNLLRLEDVQVSVLSGCSHYPVRAWNLLFEEAYGYGYDYFFQIGDDVLLKTRGWTTKFIEMLKSQNNIGTIAPCELSNYWGRKECGKRIVNENNFVHRTHYEIFGYFFYPEIRNWYCDDWITFVYNDLAKMCLDVICENEIKGNRYQILDCPHLNHYILSSQQLLSQYISK